MVTFLKFAINRKAKPECNDDNGDPLVPVEEDNLWWLTEMSARKTEEKEEQKADEDGPPGSEDEEAEKNDFTDDESMTSSDQEIPQDLYEGFFEKQKQNFE